MQLQDHLLLLLNKGYCIGIIFMGFKFFPLHYLTHNYAFL